MWQCAQTCVIDCAIIYYLSRLSTNARRFHLVQLTSASTTEGRRTEDIPRLLSPPEKADPARGPLPSWTSRDFRGCTTHLRKRERLQHRLEEVSVHLSKVVGVR